MNFDIVIPVGPNDSSIINKTINFTKANVKNYRNIYILSKSPINIENVIYINENVFPFSIDYVAERINCKERAGWYLQQLIKLFAGKYIPNILETYLVLDADVYILKELEFIDSEGKPLYCYGHEHHGPYFTHMKQLHPSLTRQKPMSGICHHMMFNVKYLNELFQLVEAHKKKDFATAFLDEAALTQPGASGASEYEIYFNFMLAYHPDQINIRNLTWRNIGSLNQKNANDDYVAVHHYIRHD